MRTTADPPLYDFLRKALSTADGGATVLYRKLEVGLRAALTEGMLEAGASLPGERELAEGLALSRATVRKALDRLVSEGFLVRRHGARAPGALRRREIPHFQGGRDLPAGNRREGPRVGFGFHHGPHAQEALRN